VREELLTFTSLSNDRDPLATRDAPSYHTQLPASCVRHCACHWPATIASSFAHMYCHCHEATGPTACTLKPVLHQNLLTPTASNTHTCPICPITCQVANSWPQSAIATYVTAIDKHITENAGTCVPIQASVMSWIQYRLGWPRSLSASLAPHSHAVQCITAQLARPASSRLATQQHGAQVRNHQLITTTLKPVTAS
jgi:hypothetical protein